MIGPFGLAPKGTMSARALALARGLAARGHDVLIAMPPWHSPAEPPRVWADQGVTLAYVSLKPRWPLISHLFITLRLVRLALSWRPDVIHCFKPKAYAGLAAWFLRHMQFLGLAKVALIVDEDDWEGSGGWNGLEDYPAALAAFFSWQERWGLRHCDGVTLASRTLESLAWGLGVPPARTQYLPNGARPAAPADGGAARREHSLDDRPIILVYTRFFEYDVTRLMEILRIVLSRMPEARALVVGQGLFASDDERFDLLVVKYGLNGRIVRTGWVSQESLPDLFAVADVALHLMNDSLVNRSKCSAKLADMLSAGVPVVADRVGQNQEYILQGQTGLLVAPGDIEAMAEAATRLLSDRELAQRLGRAAAAYMQRDYGWDALSAGLGRFYTRVLGRIRR